MLLLILGIIADTGGLLLMLRIVVDVGNFADDMNASINHSPNHVLRI